jgi:hypothetical protein
LNEDKMAKAKPTEPETKQISARLIQTIQPLLK